MLFESELKPLIVNVIKKNFDVAFTPEDIILQETRKEFDGDITLTVFNLAKKLGKNPAEFAEQLGSELVRDSLIDRYNVIKGFLNISIADASVMDMFALKRSSGLCHIQNESTSHIMLEYSSPNTNKPIHLGHMRNNLLGYSVAEILKAAGHQVTKVNLINDRGIHICKSMIAWLKFGKGETPESTGTKGDHFVGQYYVAFDKAHKKEMADLMDEGMSEDLAAKSTPILKEAQNLLTLWEKGDEETIRIWKMMNDWVYSGFDATYATMGVDFDKIYYESQTYLDGKEIVKRGLDQKVFFQKDDGSVWVDLSDEGLDQKLLLRSDGTSVYMTQDLGTALKRMEEYNPQQMIYVVGNEQDYHFKVLKLVMKKMGYSWWDSIYHLSYNMVDLPSGKMKSREGTVVDADDLIDEMIAEAAKASKELGKVDDLNTDEALALNKIIALGALKYFILRVDSDKRMLFNPNESIDLNGNTGPFIQYSHARIKSVLRKADQMGLSTTQTDLGAHTAAINEHERELILKLMQYEQTVIEAGRIYKPSIVANYAYELSKTYNRFYQEQIIIDESNAAQTRFRVGLCVDCAHVISKSMSLLGIEVPERM
ncbi:MAG TPA: arginine--tRNA ligase [Bacteroidia bacterium]|nr:arginine--tRNA ligase [Bacteroidia bacterium]HNT81020.1 arginine--tRNA ligase [Bacteroidia bacterium]